ncbi:MAG: hypothetical protein QXK11_07155 [Pyrobaculum sp.]|uniref:hypothetical protein n=1 Tax=Pyrobaculum sp. TaxID=2004705 RepID=UPI00316DB7C1
MPIYVVFRPDNYVVVTDRLRDARRAFRVKYSNMKWETRYAWLRIYGNVTYLPRIKIVYDNLPSVCGIYRIDELYDVLSKIFKKGDTINRYYNMIKRLAEKIEREPRPSRPKDFVPLKIMGVDPYDERLLLSILKNKSDMLFSIYADYTEKLYICETKNFYCIYDTKSGVYVSVRKDASVNDIIGYMLENLLYKAQKYLGYVDLVDCEKVFSLIPGFRELCRKVMDILAQMKVTLSLVE